MWPFLVANAVGLINLAIDRIWVGRVGTEALAALGIAQVTLGVLWTVQMGMAVGTLAGVARATGAGDPAEARRVCANGLFISLALGLALALLAWPLPPLVLGFMDAEAAVAAPASGYLAVSMAGLVINAPLMALTFALQGAGEAKAAMRVSLASPVVNAILDPLFIFTLDGGLPGAAWATNVGNLVSLAVAFLALRHGRLRLSLARVDLVFAPRVARRIVAVGVPGTLEQTVRTVASFSLVKILNGFGATVVSAYTGTMMVVLVLIFPGLALGQAAASLVGQNLGAGQRGRAVRTAWLAVGIYVGFMVVLGLLIHLTAPDLIGVFDRNPVVMAEGAAQLRVLVWCLPTLAMALVLGKAFGGAGNTIPAMAAAFVAHLALQIPLAWWLAERHGAVGAYWAMACAFGVHGLLSAGLFVWRVHGPRAEGRLAPRG
jgi:putative MATE family efflux protein